MIKQFGKNNPGIPGTCPCSDGKTKKTNTGGTG